MNERHRRLQAIHENHRVRQAPLNPLHNAHVSEFGRVQSGVAEAKRAALSQAHQEYIERLRFTHLTDDDTVALTGHTFESLIDEVMESVFITPRRDIEPTALPTVPTGMRNAARTRQNIVMLRRCMIALPFIPFITSDAHIAYYRRHATRNPVIDVEAFERALMPAIPEPHPNELRLAPVDDCEWIAADNSDSVWLALKCIDESLRTRYVDPLEFEPVTVIDEFDYRAIRQCLRTAVSHCNQILSRNTNSKRKDIQQMRYFRPLLTQSLMNLKHRQDQIRKGGLHPSGGEVRHFERERLTIGLALMFMMLNGKHPTASHPKTNLFIIALGEILSHNEDTTPHDRTLLRLTNLAVEALPPKVEKPSDSATWLRIYREQRRRLYAAHAEGTTAQIPILPMI